VGKKTTHPMQRGLDSKGNQGTLNRFGGVRLDDGRLSTREPNGTPAKQSGPRAGERVVCSRFLLCARRKRKQGSRPTNGKSSERKEGYLQMTFAVSRRGGERLSETKKRGRDTKKEAGVGKRVLTSDRPGKKKGGLAGRTGRRRGVRKSKTWGHWREKKVVRNRGSRWKHREGRRTK